MDNDVEMWGKGYKKQEIESDNESTTFSEEDDDEYDSQSDDYDDQSEGGDEQSVISDESEDDDYDDRDDIIYMRGFGDIKFVGDKIYELADSKLNLDDDDIEINGDVYKLCGDVLTCRGKKLYLINGMLFQECEDIENDEIINW